MPNTQPISKEEYIAMRTAKAQAKAEREWEEKQRNPKKIGRPDDYEKITNTIVEIVETNGGMSGPTLELWTEDKWITEVEKRMKKGDTSGEVTIKKYLKNAFKLHTTLRHLIPLHMIPARWVQDKPREERMERFFCLALLEAIMMNKGSTRTLFSTVNDSHRRLCNKHLWKAKRLPEDQRIKWCQKKFEAICALNPAIAPPRNSKIQ